jgi:hypothetical protein
MGQLFDRCASFLEVRSLILDVLTVPDRATAPGFGLHGGVAHTAGSRHIPHIFGPRGRRSSRVTRNPWRA